nr:APC family permease [Desulfuromonas sp. TF]
MNKADNGKIGFWAVVAIGIGGMVGGGIFCGDGSGGAAGTRRHTSGLCALAGGVALTTYSYAKLSVAYPSRGGTVTFLDRAFGAGMFTGSLNLLLWLGHAVQDWLQAEREVSEHKARK